MKLPSNLPESEKQRRLNQSALDKQKRKDNLFKGKNTPIFNAIKHNDTEMIDELLAEGWDINHKGVYGFTPLSFSITYANKHITDFLISRGAKVDYQAIISAIHCYNPDIKKIESFIESCDLTEKQLLTLLEQAKLKEVNFTLPQAKLEMLNNYQEREKKANLQVNQSAQSRLEKLKEKESNNPSTLFKKAIEELDFDLLKTLPKEHINTARINYSQSVLSYAINFTANNTSKESIKIVKQLIKMGAILPKDATYYTVDFYNIIHADQRLAIQLIEMGVKYVNYSADCDTWGGRYRVNRTNIFKAIKDKKFRYAEFFLKNNYNKYNNAVGLFILSLLINVGNYSLAEQLIENLDLKKCYYDYKFSHRATLYPFTFDFMDNSYFCDPIEHCIETKNTSLLDKIIEKVKDCDCVNLTYLTPSILRLPYEDREEFYSIFAKHNVKFSQRVFLDACRKLDYELLQKLIDWGYDINNDKDFGLPTMIEVVKWCCTDNDIAAQKAITLLKWLNSKGGNINVKINYYSPLFMACYYNKPEVIQLVLDLGGGSKSEVEAHFATFEVCSIVEGKKKSTLEHVYELVKKGANLNYDGRDGSRTPIIIKALDNGTYKFLPALLSGNADLELQDPHEKNFFERISILDKERQKKIFEIILPYADKFGVTALNAVIEKPYDFYDRNLLQKLISSSLDINAGTSDEKTPLYVACVENNTEAVDLLLANGANVNTLHNYFEEDIIKYVTFNNIIKDKEVFLSKGPLTPLMVAALLGNYNIVRKLIEYGADVNAVDDDGNNVLMLLLKDSNFYTNEFINETDKDKSERRIDSYIKIIQILIAANVDTDLKNNEGESARDLVYKTIYPDICRYFENSNGYNTQKSLALRELIISKKPIDEQTLEKFISEGADINFVSGSDSSPLIIFALQHKKFNIINKMLALGADQTLQNNNSESFLNCFRIIYDEDIALLAETLLKNVKNVSSGVLHSLMEPKTLKAESLALELLKKFLDSGMDIENKVNNDETLLYRACIDQKIAAVKLFLDYGAKVNTFHAGAANYLYEYEKVTNRPYCRFKPITPLMISALLANEQIVDLLIEHGADVNAVDERGDNALTILLSERPINIATGFGHKRYCVLKHRKDIEKYANIIKKLIAAGIDINHKNKLDEDAKELILRPNNRKLKSLFN